MNFPAWFLFVAVHPVISLVIALAAVFGFCFGIYWLVAQHG